MRVINRRPDSVWDGVVGITEVKTFMVRSEG